MKRGSPAAKTPSGRGRSPGGRGRSPGARGTPPSNQAGIGNPTHGRGSGGSSPAGARAGEGDHGQTASGRGDRASTPANQAGRGYPGHGCGSGGSSPAGARAGEGDHGQTASGRGDRASTPANQAGRGYPGHGCGSGGSSPAGTGAAEGGHGQRPGGGDGDLPYPKDSPKSSPSPTTKPSTPSTPPCTPPTPTPPPFLGELPEGSYAVLATIRPEEHAAHRFFGFLERAKIDSKNEPFYLAQLKSMKAKGIFKIQVDFGHLRALDRRFAHYVCNNRASLKDWFLSAVRKLLLHHYFTAEEMASDDAVNIGKNEILLYTELTFSNMPQRIESLAKLLERNNDALSEFLDIGFQPGKSVLISTTLGNHVFYNCVCHLLENHTLGKCWDGDFNLTDWDVINGSQIVLSKPHTKTFEIEFGAADLSKVNDQLMPLYLKKNKDGEIVTPLYFKELDNDLKEISKVLKEEDLDWFREYMPSNPAYSPAMARINLTRGLFREVVTHNLSSDTNFQDILNDPEECFYDDWRNDINETTGSALYKLFWHGIPAQERKMENCKFSNSLGGSLHLERNSYEHLEEKTRDLRGKQMMKNSIEGEAVTVEKMEKCLTDLIKKLLKKCKMKGPLSGVWQVYKSAGLIYKVTVPKAK